MTMLNPSVCRPSGRSAGERHWLVSQSPWLRMLAVRHRRQHSDAQPAVSGAVRGRRGETERKLISFPVNV